MSKKPSLSPVSSKTDEDFQAEEDARTLQRIGEIMSDPKRHAKAKKQMEKMMADMKKSHGAMKMMAGMKAQEDESMGGMIKKRQKGEAA